MPRLSLCANCHRRFCVLFVLLFVTVITVPVAGHPVSASTGLPKYIDEYSIPTTQAGPLAITVDQYGVIWFTESNVSKLGRFDPASNSFSEYAVPGVGDMWGIIVDHTGVVWFAQYSGRGSVNPGGEIVGGGQGRLGHFDPRSKNVSFVDIPTIGSFPMRLAVDDQNRIWFTELLGNRTGVYDQADKTLREFEVSKTLSGPADLSFDRHGALWFTESFAHNIVRFIPENQSLTEYSLMPYVFSPIGIAVDDYGNVWTADHGGNWIAELEPQTNKITRYPTVMLPDDLAIPNGLLIDREGKVWFSEHIGNSIGYLDPSTKTLVEFPIPSGPISTALWIALAPNGDVWFTEWSANKIGVVHASLQIPVSLQPSQSNLLAEVGGGASIFLTTKSSQDLGLNGTFRYTWGSYNPREISVTFSPHYLSIAGVRDTTTRADLEMSSTAKTGNFTLGLGIDAGNVRVWSMIQVQVIQPANRAPPNAPLTLLGLPVLLLAGLIVLFSSRQARKRRESAV